MTGLTDTVGNRTTWSYDAGDRMTTMADALGTATYVYDAADQMVDKTDRAGRRTTFAFDSGGRQTNERWFNGSTILRTMTFTYDAADQLTGATDPDATLTFTYDSGGRMTSAATSSAAGQPNVTLSYTYNESGDRISMTDNLSSVGRTTYSYDAAHRLTTITRSIGGTAGPQVVFGYDAANRKTSISRTIGGTGTAVTSSFAYDNANRLTTLTHQVSGGSGLATYVYGYDDVNRVNSETNAEGSVTYTYDATSQLTGVTGARSESYSYDLGGNRTMTGYTIGAGNQLTASPGYTYSYDGEGNLISKTETATGRVTTFSYDHHNRLTGTTRSLGGTVEASATYTYDVLGRRIQTNVDNDGVGSGSPVNTWTIFNNRNPYADFDGGGSLLVRYQHGTKLDELLSKTDASGATKWHLSDQLGSVRDISNTSGALLGHRAYDSFGQISVETGSGLDRFAYTGREYNSETASYYYRARFYDPQMGSFLSLDPIGFSAGDSRLYNYVSNNPVNAVDPTGEKIFLILDRDAEINHPIAGPIKVGHMAIIVQDGNNGYKYYSVGPKGFKNNPQGLIPWGEVEGELDTKTTKTFNEMMDFIKSKGYDTFQTWETTNQQDQKAIRYLDQNYLHLPPNVGFKYKAGAYDCVSLVSGVMEAVLGRDYARVWKDRDTNGFGQPRRTRSFQRTYNYFYENDGTTYPFPVRDGRGKKQHLVEIIVDTYIKIYKDTINNHVSLGPSLTQNVREMVGYSVTPLIGPWSYRLRLSDTVKIDPPPAHVFWPSVCEPINVTCLLVRPSSKLR